MAEMDDDYPCDNCAHNEWCDGWEAAYCCRLCLYHNDDPDCEHCDPMDI